MSLYPPLTSTFFIDFFLKVTYLPPINFSTELLFFSLRYLRTFPVSSYFSYDWLCCVILFVSLYDNIFFVFQGNIRASTRDNSHFTYHVFKPNLAHDTDTFSDKLVGFMKDNLELLIAQETVMFVGSLEHHL